MAGGASRSRCLARGAGRSPAAPRPRVRAATVGVVTERNAENAIEELKAYEVRAGARAGPGARGSHGRLVVVVMMMS